jgi:hypothetical protein
MRVARGFLCARTNGNASKVVASADMTEKKQLPPSAGKGRVKGVPNKVTAELKDMIRTALDKAGGVEYLVEQASANPTAFMSLIGRILPKDIKVEAHNYNHRELSDAELTAALVRAGVVAETTSAKESSVVH